MGRPPSNGYLPDPGDLPSPYAVQPRSRKGRHAPARKRQHCGRGALIRGGALIVIAAGVTAFAATGDHKQNASLSSAGTVQAAAPVPRSSLPPSCQASCFPWRGSGAGNQLQAVTTDLGNVSQAASSLGSDLPSGADPPADEAALQSAAASLQSDIQAAEDNLIPDCVQSGHEAEGCRAGGFQQLCRRLRERHHRDRQR
jgi:hypothetical protein